MSFIYETMDGEALRAAMIPIFGFARPCIECGEEDTKTIRSMCSLGSISLEYGRPPIAICEMCALEVAGIISVRHEGRVFLPGWNDWPEEQEESVAGGPKIVRKTVSHQDCMIVFERDGFACVHCGAQTQLQPDHKLPVSLGGTNDIANLQTACMPCNVRRGNRVSWKGRKALIMEAAIGEAA